MLQKFKLFWFPLMAGSALIGVYFAQAALGELWSYCRQSSQLPALVRQWEVRELKNGKYAIFAQYQFQIQEKIVQGATLFSEPLFPNQYAALDAIKEKFMKERQTVWFAPRNLQYSTIQRKFPLLLLIRSGIAFAVLFYFFIIKKRIISNIN